MQELTHEQTQAASGGCPPLVLYLAAVAVGAALGAGISLVQGFVETRRAAQGGGGD